MIPPKLNSLRHPNTYSVMRCRNNYFKNFVIPYVVREWNKLSTEIRNSTSYQQFRKSLLSFIKPTCSSLFSIHQPVGVKLLVRLRLGFSHLGDHKFRHNFHDTLNPLCSCSLEPETTSHYLLCCHNFSSARLALMNDLNLIDPTIYQLNETVLANILLYGDSKKSTPVLSDIYLQQNDLMTHSSKSHNYMHALYYLDSIPENAILVTADVVGLYPIIPHEVGLRALREALDKRDGKTIPTEELSKKVEFVLKNNYFEFGNKKNSKSPELQLGLNLPHHTRVFS